MLKHCVDARGVKPEILLALINVQPIFAKRGIPMVITSLLDGNHMYHSLHYQGLAVDLRSKHLRSDKDKQSVLDEIRIALGPQYDVLLESLGKPQEHYHIEFDPK